MRINLYHIPSATAWLFEQLAKEKYMNRFSLVGGTALALQLGHRQSEDLDFIFDGEKINAIWPTEHCQYCCYLSPENGY